jgi:signal transduction histidine kinase/ActR/RegA family two-component response regulator
MQEVGTEPMMRNRITRAAAMQAANVNDLRERLREAEETLQAIRSGEVDALVVDGSAGAKVYTLKGAEHPYRLLVEQMSEGAATLLSDGIILYCNRRLAVMLGVPMQKIVGSSIYRFVGGENGEALAKLIEGTAAELAEDLGGQQEGDDYPQEGAVNTRKAGLALEIEASEADRPDGAEGESEGEAAGRTPVYVSASGLLVEGLRAVCIIVTDLTEQKRSQQKLEAGRQKLAEEQLKANKLESIGILAGGLAHDLNNSLTAILGNIALAKRSPSGGNTSVSKLAEAEAACLQARDVTQQLLTFSKGGVPVRKTMSIEPLLREWARFAISGSNAVLEFEIAGDLKPVEIDEGQVSRVINNLVINAQQAMPQGGTITLRAENVTLSSEQAEAAGLPLHPGDYVEIAVQDRGTGIPEANISRIFDPYFTTKEQGSGLGLAIAYSVVRNHGGHLAVESEPGAGSTFRVYLASSGNTAPEAEVAEPSREPRPLRVLVMDDHEAIRDVIGEILEEVEGHQVAFARDGAEALEMYRQSLVEARRFNVVLMDLTIAGGLGGKETIKELLQMDPEAKAIVFSGYSNDSIMARYREYGFSGVLRKPFGMDELLNELHRVARM